MTTPTISGCGIGWLRFIGMPSVGVGIPTPGASPPPSSALGGGANWVGIAVEDPGLCDAERPGDLHEGRGVDVAGAVILDRAHPDPRDPDPLSQLAAFHPEQDPTARDYATHGHAGFSEVGFCSSQPYATLTM